METPDADAVLDRMTDALFAVDRDWRFTYLNERARTLVGRAARAAHDHAAAETAGPGAAAVTGGEEAAETDLLGRRLWDLTPGDRPEPFASRFERALETGEPVSFEAEYEPMGAWFEVRAFPSETGLSVYFREVTERKQRQRQRDRDRAALQELYRIAAERETPFEAKVERVLRLGCDYLDVPYGFVNELESDQLRIAHAHGVPGELEPGTVVSREEAYCKETVRTDGLLAIVDAVEDDWGGDPAYEATGLGCYIGGQVYSEDADLERTLCFAGPSPRTESFSETEQSVVELLTQWLSYEYERRAARRELERKNDRLENLASVVSHDLVNPLNVAMARLEFVDRAYDPGDGEDHLAVVRESLERIDSLLDDLSTLAREGAVIDERSPLALGAVVDEAWTTVPTDTATLRKDDELAEYRLAGDESRLQQALENLFDNALHHGGEAVTVEVGTLSDGFYVQDDGPGIPEAEREKVLEPGYTTSEDGSGMGVAIVREVVEAHGWSVTIGESPDGGARFEITGIETA